MKLLVVVSALDLRYRLGCTPHWWQLLKALYVGGVDVVVVPYLGPAVESLWWRVYQNPCQAEGEAYARLRAITSRFARRAPKGESALARRAVERIIRPRWERQLRRIAHAERGVDAALFVSVPPAHLAGLPALVRDLIGGPALFYDGDAPASLPRFGGFASGFRIYDGADLAEYDAVIANSAGVTEDLEALGARAVYPLHWAADPEVYAPLHRKREQDVFFYGYGDAYRERWMAALLAEPSRRLSDVRFAVGGGGFKTDLGSTRRIGDVPFNQFVARCSASLINLNITRDAHASVYASSSARIFELAMMGCAVVSNPVSGLDTWFEPGRELLVVEDADQAVETYQGLLADDGARRRLGAAARARCLAEHTYRHRAAELCEILERYRQ